jgi:hypothetical protein
MKYLAIVDCASGWELFNNSWYRKYSPVTIGEFSTRLEAERAAAETCNFSPKDCCNPRVVIKGDLNALLDEFKRELNIE